MFKYKLLLIYFVLGVAFSLVGCDQGKNLENIDFEDTAELKEARAVQGAEINISVGSMITPQEGYAYYKKLLDYIGKKLNMKVNFIEKMTYAEVNALLKNGGIDVAFVCGGPYIIGHDEFGLQLLAVPMIEGKTVYYSYIIVNKDSEIERFQDLKGKTFAFVDPLSNTGKLIPTYMLQKLGETPQRFFKEYSYTYSHDDSIKAVARGVVDGAAVDSIIWEYISKKGYKYIEKTRIIKVSEPYGIPPVVARPGIEEHLRQNIKNILLTMHEEKEGKDILSGMFIDKFVEADDSIYDTIRSVKAQVKE